MATYITKFNKGDKVWTIINGKAVQDVVKTVMVNDSIENDTTTSYWLNITSYNVTFRESYLFSSREELINSL